MDHEARQYRLSLHALSAHPACWAMMIIMLVSAICWTFWPALTGPFIFDDFGNLNQLAWLNGGISVDSVKQMLIASNAGPSGRPLSVLSFLINDVAWPSDPESFKYTNLMLHCLNSLLLFWLIKLVLDQVVPRESGINNLLAVLLVGFWAVNPYQMSSVMYVVQRMALMATTFVLVGLITYVKGRQAMIAGRVIPGFGMIWAGYLIACLIGGLSKENAILFVLLVPLFELALFQKADQRRNLLLRLTLVGPAVIFFALLLYLWPSHQDQYHYLRDFTLSERLLSEGRALGYYLWRYLVPGVSYVGIFADGFEKSTGWLSPASTLLWWMVHGALLIFAWRLRSRWPLVFLAVSFFYVGHSLESTYLPLELFFEHRNYLPSMLLLLGLAHLQRLDGLVVGLCLLVVICLPLNRIQAKFWSDEHDLFVIMMSENPRSERARLVFASYVEGNFGPESVIEVMEPFKEEQVVGPEFALNWVFARCRLGQDTQDDIDLLMDSVENRRMKPPTMVSRGWQMSAVLMAGQCATLSIDDYEAFIEKVFTYHPQHDLGMQSYYLSKGILQLVRSDYDAFKEMMYQAMETPPLNASMSFGVCQQFENMGDLPEACACYRRYEPDEGPILDLDRNKLRRLLGWEEYLREGFQSGIVETCVIESEEENGIDDQQFDGDHSGQE